MLLKSCLWTTGCIVILAWNFTYAYSPFKGKFENSWVKRFSHSGHCKVELLSLCKGCILVLKTEIWLGGWTFADLRIWDWRSLTHILTSTNVLIRKNINFSHWTFYFCLFFQTCFHICNNHNR